MSPIVGGPMAVSFPIGAGGTATQAQLSTIQLPAGLKLQQHQGIYTYSVKIVNRRMKPFVIHVNYFFQSLKYVPSSQLYSPKQTKCVAEFQTDRIDFAGQTSSNVQHLTAAAAVPNAATITFPRAPIYQQQQQPQLQTMQPQQQQQQYRGQNQAPQQQQHSADGKASSVVVASPAGGKRPKMIRYDLHRKKFKHFANWILSHKD